MNHSALISRCMLVYFEIPMQHPAMCAHVVWRRWAGGRVGKACGQAARQRQVRFAGEAEDSAAQLLPLNLNMEDSLQQCMAVQCSVYRFKTHLASGMPRVGAARRRPSRAETSTHASTFIALCGGARARKAGGKAAALILPQLGSCWQVRQTCGAQSMLHSMQPCQRLAP